MTGYVFDFGGHGKFDPNGRVEISDHQAHNRMVEAAELAQWAQRPDRFGAYVTENRVTSWLGTEIGTVVRSSTFRNNLAGRTTCLTIRGNNGATYYGRYGADWSQFIRLRKAK